MFSGLVQAIGTLEHADDSAAGRELGINCSFDDLQHGESVAINGVCLTVRECGRAWFTVAAGQQTMERTTISEWQPGRELNLERALRAGDRLGGHLVQGHVDGVAQVTDVRDEKGVLYVAIELQPELSELFVPLGSVAIDGVSLTVNAVIEPDSIEVAVIDYTRRNTTLGGLSAGARVHVEADVIAKYVRQMVAPYLARLAPEP